MRRISEGLFLWSICFLGCIMQPDWLLFSVPVERCTLPGVVWAPGTPWKCHLLWIAWRRRAVPATALSSLPWPPTWFMAQLAFAKRVWENLETNPLHLGDSLQYLSSGKHTLQLSLVTVLLCSSVGTDLGLLQNALFLAWLRNCHLCVLYLCVTFLSSYDDKPPPTGKSQGISPYPMACSQWHLINVSGVSLWKYFVQFKAILSFQKSPNMILNTKHYI